MSLCSFVCLSSILNYFAFNRIIFSLRPLFPLGYNINPLIFKNKTNLLHYAQIVIF